VPLYYALEPAGKWFCLPLMMASNHLPAPVGGYFTPMDGTFFFTLFFVITTWVTWNYEKR